MLFTERIIRGMGGDGERAHECAVEMTAAWEHAHNFELYEDVLPTLSALRAQGLKLALVSNTARDLDRFVAHHHLDVDVALSSRMHGRVKPHESIFRAVLSELDVRLARPRWWGTRWRTTSKERARSGCGRSCSIAKAVTPTRRNRARRSARAGRGSRAQQRSRPSHVLSTLTLGAAPRCRTTRMRSEAALLS